MATVALAMGEPEGYIDMFVTKEGKIIFPNNSTSMIKDFVAKGFNVTIVDSNFGGENQ